jgi:hypothetical protein
MPRDVGHHDEVGFAAGGGLLSGEGGGGRLHSRRVQKRRGSVVTVVGDDQIGVAVAVNVGHRRWVCCRCEWLLVSEGGRGRSRRRGVQKH